MARSAKQAVKRRPQLKKAYLTIDDAPSPDFTAKMEFLQRLGLPAIFFCEGRSIQLRQTELHAAIEHGFLIGNHSFNHPHFSDLSTEQCKQEILTTDELIEALYRAAGRERPAKYFRFPYFDTGGDASAAANQAKWSRPVSEWFKYERDDRRREIQAYLRALGYRQPKFEGINPDYIRDPDFMSSLDVRCTFDQAEYWLHEPNAPWGLSTETAILERIDQDLPYEGRALNRADTVDIILIHDHVKTTALFYRLVERYVEKGIHFLPIPTATLN